MSYSKKVLKMEVKIQPIEMITIEGTEVMNPFPFYLFYKSKIYIGIDKRDRKVPSVPSRASQGSALVRLRSDRVEVLETGAGQVHCR